VPYTKGPILEAETWDGDAAEARVRKWASKDGSGDKDQMDWARYRSAFAYVDADGSDAFGGYHLLHHDVADGSLKVARKGVFAAASIIQGGRGGAEFVARIGTPAADGIRAHLGKHYEDMDATPPWEEKAAEIPAESPAPESKSVPADEVGRLYAEYLDTFEAPLWAASPIGR
jgi:hypothetical protein